MNRILSRLAALAMLVVLAACSATVGPTSLQFGLTESGTLGYEVDDEGAITITSRQMNFQARAGDAGRTITSYRIEFLNSAGNPVNAADNVQIGSMYVYVPGGIQCDAPHPVTGCQLGDPTARFANGPVATSQPYNLMPGTIAVAHLAAGAPVEWHALIRFNGFDARGTTFETVDYRLAISPPD